MKIRIIGAVLLFSLFVTHAPGATNGFLSFDYSQGLSKDVEEAGIFHGVQIGLIFSGLISQAIGYSAELHYRDGRFEAQEAWLSLFSSESFRFKMGLFLVPFGKYNSSRRPYETLLVHAPLNIEYTFPSYWRDIGAVAEGRIGSFSYSAYLGNGLAEGASLSEGQQFEDNNANKSLGGRISWFLSQAFEVGYSYYRGKADDADERETVLHDVDVSWNDQSFQILAEYTRGGMDNPESFERGEVEGFFVQTSITLQSFYPVISFQNLKYSDLFHGQGFLPSGEAGDGIDVDRSRWTFGVVYAPAQGVLFKLEYDMDKDKLTDVKENRITFQAALRF